MGIPGLTTYINKRSQYYFKPYQLHDTYLIIDGNGLARQLYNLSNSYCAFGGDYDKYGRVVREFFTQLSQCNITPLVLIDGGSEDKKLNTVIRRISERIKLVGSFNIRDEYRMTKVYPTLMKESFKDILIELKIKFAVTTFEADGDIAAIASILKCPILSLDSDFYIYDVIYILLDKLDAGVTEIPGGNGYMKTCKMYKVDLLLQNFKGLSRSILPLFAALLGNDYIENYIFSNFFRNLKLPKPSAKLYNEQQRRIDATLSWLQHHTLDSAIQIILGRVQKDQRNNVLRKIELVVNGYVMLSPMILASLDFEEAYVNEMTQLIKKTPYRYENNALVIKETKTISLETSTIGADGSVYDILPKWFINEFNAGHFPAFFMDILTRQLNVMTVQIEDIKYPSCNIIALPILRVMYKLLTTGILEPSKPLQYFVRNVNNGYKNHILDCPDKILGEDFPSLHHLREVPMNTRRRIIDETMGINPEMKIEESWQLFIGSLILWLKEDIEPRRNNIHVYTVLFTMLFHIVDSKIGVYRIEKNFEHTYGRKVEEMEEAKKRGKITDQLLFDVSLEQAINEVAKEDCLKAAPFFISKFDMNEDLRSNPKNFNITVVHVFSLLQSCLKHILYVNALLGYPYKDNRIE